IWPATSKGRRRSAPMRSATRPRPTCWTGEPTSVAYRSYSVTLRCRLLSSTPTSQWRGSVQATDRRTPARDARRPSDVAVDPAVEADTPLDDVDAVAANEA